MLIKNSGRTCTVLSFLALFSFYNYLNGSVFFYVILFVAFYFLINHSLQIKNKRIINYSFYSAAFFSLLYIIGYHIHHYGSLDPLVKSNYFKNLLVFTGQTILLYAVLSIVFDFFSGNKSIGSKTKLNYLPQKSNHFFLVVWAFIFICWIPYLIINFPGIISPDSLDKIKQALGDIPLDDWNPIFHTFLVSIFIKSGEILFGSLNAGVAFHSVLQMLIMSAAFAFTVGYLNKLRINKLFVLFAILFYAFYPVHGTYAVTIWSDPLFNVAILILLVCLVELIINTSAFFRSRLYIFLFILSTMVMVLIRNNGIYLFVLTLPILLYFLKEQKGKTAILCGACLVAIALIKGPFYDSLHPKPPPTGEYLSLMLQQIARVAKLHGKELSDKDIHLIDSYIDYKITVNEYNPDISDPVKRIFKDGYFKEDKKDFFRLWWNLCTRYPLTYIESFIWSGYGYWYPEVKYWILGAHINKNYYGIHQVKLLPKTISPSIVRIGVDKLRNIPILSLCFSIGFIFWCLCLSAILCCFMHRPEFIVIFIPLLGLLLTAIASPVFAEFRYVYGFFTCLPLIIAIPFWIKNQKPANLIQQV